MSAVNSLQPLEAPVGEPHPSEPSMEEILASIRRIIADDHSLPERPDVGTDESDHGQEDEHHTPEMPTGSPSTSVLHPQHSHEGPASASIASHEAEVAMRETAEVPMPHDSDPAAALAAAMAHGHIAAPQYASPDGPHAHVAEMSPVHENGAPDAVHDDSLHHATPLDNAPASDHAPVPEHAPIPGHAPSMEEPAGLDQVSSVMDHDAGTRDMETARPVDDSMAAVVSASTRNSVVSAFNTLAAARLADNSEELATLVRSMLRPLLVSWLDVNLPPLVERMVRDEIERVARGH